MRCHAIAVVQADAASVPIPDGRLVLYFFFNPFARPVMRLVVDQVVAGFQAQPRRMIVLYANPVCADLWRGAAGFTEISSRWQRLAIFDTQACCQGTPQR